MISKNLDMQSPAAFLSYKSPLGVRGLFALMQKVSIISLMLVVSGLEYFTRQEDFELIKPGGIKIQASNC
jgi:hypothetical protein